MMYCQHCGADNIETSMHCIRCGFDMVNQKKVQPVESDKVLKEKAAKINWWWPDVSKVEIAEKAVQGGVWAALFVSSMTALCTIIALNSDNPDFTNLGLTAWAYLDAALFAWVAYGLHKHSRVAALAGLILFCLARMDHLANGNVGYTTMTIAIVVAFIGAIRGTFSLHHLKENSQ